jgi:hypothetical protein
MVNDRHKSRDHALLLAKLREQHEDTVARTRALLKSNQEDRRAIARAMREGASTVPEIAAASLIPAERVLWHVTAMRKYDLVAEIGKSDGYFRYAMVEKGAGQ